MSKLIHILKSFGKYEIGYDDLRNMRRSKGQYQFISNLLNFSNRQYLNYNEFIITKRITDMFLNDPTAGEYIDEYSIGLGFVLALEGVKYWFHRKTKDYNSRINGAAHELSSHTNSNVFENANTNGI